MARGAPRAPSVAGARYARPNSDRKKPRILAQITENTSLPASSSRGTSGRAEPCAAAGVVPGSPGTAGADPGPARVVAAGASAASAAARFFAKSSVKRAARSLTMPARLNCASRPVSVKSTAMSTAVFAPAPSSARR